MQKLVKKEYQIPFILVTSLFFLWGFAHAILDVLNKHFQEALVMTKEPDTLTLPTISLLFPFYCYLFYTHLIHLPDCRES